MTARRWLGRMRRRLSSRRFVLVYHRVAEPAHDPWRLAVSPARFGEHLEVLRRHGPVLPLDSFLRALEAGTLPRCATALTFDDGYADTLFAAKPLLERHDLPATVHLCPVLLDGRTAFWWDALARIVFEPAVLPCSLEMCLGSVPFDWTPEPAPTSRSDARESDRSGAVLCNVPPATPTRSQRAELYEALCGRMRSLPLDEQQRAVAALAAWADVAGVDDAAARPLDRAEAVRLAADGLVAIGAHTLTHASLPACDPVHRAAEITGSKAACEEIAGGPVASFSYPYNDHDAASAAAVREAGFAYSWTTAAASLRAAANRFCLPRVPVQDWGGAEFERRLVTADFA